MQSTHNLLLLKAIKKEPVHRTPIWIMRQAGRYLPEYITTKNKAGGFINLIRNPELACEITLQPLQRYNLDAAILFSDILVISDLLGMKLRFEENKGPIFDKTICSKKDLNTITDVEDVDKLDYVFNTIKLLKNELYEKKPLIGFIGSPWTVATYLIEGNSSKKFLKVMSMVNKDEALMHNILNILTTASIAYLKKQIEAGIDVAMIFDTWGSLLKNELYEKFSLNYVRKIREALAHTNVPIIYYVRQTSEKINILKDLDIDVLGLDSTSDIGAIKKVIGSKYALQGNLDVNVLKEEEKIIIEKVEDTLKKYNSKTGHIFNLGTGITPDIDPDKVKLLIDILADISPKYNVK